MPRSHALRLGRHSADGQVYLLTTITHQREPIFADFQCARVVIQQMRLCCEQGLSESLAWVVMPDHLHWLMALRSGSLAGLMRRLKARTSQQLRQCGLHQGLVWQRNFHDRALRSDEDLCGVARYIAANPLRAGLCRNLADYPHWDAVWL